ncbi:VCBS repeat-containing protein [Streptomyces sp. NPDC056501]|uniref:VCBS repeat-containing protein n=1 Tax=Streptomyces sp. NPDC056501 TaxID=3345841 RepID=UPI003688649A
MKNRITRRRPALSAAVVAATAAALLGTALSPQGAAAPTVDSSGQELTASPSPEPEEAASRQAKETGERVEVLAQRTENTQLFADPSGTFTEERYVLPRWTTKDNALVPIDTTLVKTQDGHVTTRATKAGISFSAGGTGEAVTLSHNNRSMSLGWPTALPEPRLDGDTATYPEVLPGVDLLLRAGNNGFSQLLVVKTPQAAASPALDSIRFAMGTDGVEVATDAHGNLKATNPAGQEVFVAPSPRMWDSSTPAALSRAAAAQVQESESDPFEPGTGAKQATLGLSVGDDSLALVPDQSLLSGQDTTFPVYIDPEYSVPGAREAWALAYKATPNTAYFGGAGWHNSDGSVGTNTARVGYENYTNGLARSFFRMDSNNLWNTRKKIKSSTFRIENEWSWSCNDRPVDLWLTGGISTATTWNSQDNSGMWARKLNTVDDSKGWGPDCPAGNLAFDVTSAAQEAATEKWAHITMGLRVPNETDVYSWKKFDARTAVLTTVYNTYPNAVRYLDTTPDTQTDACVEQQPVAFPDPLGNTDLTLVGTFSDPDGGTLKARFELWPEAHYDSGPKVATTLDVTSGRNGKLLVTKETLKQFQSTAGTSTFHWRARAEDGELTGPWTPTCTFQFDAIRPSSPPRVTSTVFPDGSDGWPAQTGLARKPGVFQIVPLDAGQQATIEYWTDWDPTVRKLQDVMPLGANVTLTPPSTGRHFLSARSLDAAGNVSNTTRYWFYANGPKTPDRPGDLNGDALADFYAVRSDGDLLFYPGQGNGRHAPPTSASNFNFTGASVTHRGDWTQDGFEDLAALVPTSEGKQLRVYANNGVGYACSRIGEEADGASRSCAYDVKTFDVRKRSTPDFPVDGNNHWKNATEILAVGDVDGPLDTNNDGKIESGIDVPGRPDLLVKEGGQLWLYFGTASQYLDEKDPILIGTGGWTDFSLSAPGDYDKNGHVDLIARHKITGELKFYAGTDATGGGLANGAASTEIGSGWTATNRPLFTATPDANGDGKSDLWATGGDGKLYFYADPRGIGTIVGTGGWSPFQNLA